jgi:hypothetical protein
MLNVNDKTSKHQHRSVAQNPIERAAHSLCEGGVSVIPIKSDGTKSPAVLWKRYQSQCATLEELQETYE